MTGLKRILDSYEELADERLREVCERNDARVFSKVRLADVFPISGSGISNEHYRFALQSHFDFLVTDDRTSPLFAVEYDGNAHNDEEQRTRDRIKDSLCEAFGLPLLRINSNYLWRPYRGMDLLTWFIEVWFAWKWYQTAKATGEIPWDEVFSPWAIISIPGNNLKFPLWLSRPLRYKIQNLCIEGKIRDSVPQAIVVRCKSGSVRAIAYVGLDDNTGVMAQTGMRSQHFPIGEFEWSEADALDELVIFELYQRLESVLAEEERPIPKSHFIAAAKSLLENCQLIRGMYSDDELKKHL